MNRPARHHLPHFFSHHPTVQLEELVVSVGILEFALAAVALFEPIYLFSLGFSLVQVMGFYFAVYTGYAFLIPLGGKFVGRFGYERTMLLASFVYVGYYLALFSIPANEAFLWIAAIAFAIQKSLYWPAFHLDFVRHSFTGEVGREFSAAWSVTQLVSVIGPLAGGAVAALLGFQTLFIIVIGLILASNVPLFFSRDDVERQDLAYGDSFALFRNKALGRQSLAYLGFGEELIWMSLWPIFMFIVLKNTIGVGLIVALASLVTVVTTLVSGRLTDSRQSPKRVLSLSSAVLSGLWLLRAFLITPFQLFLGDSLGRVFKNASFVPLIAITYERARQDRSLRYVVYFEQVLSIGKALVALAFIFLLPHLSSFAPVFIIAGAVTLLYLFL